MGLLSKITNVLTLGVAGKGPLSPTPAVPTKVNTLDTMTPEQQQLMQSLIAQLGGQFNSGGGRGLTGRQKGTQNMLDNLITPELFGNVNTQLSKLLGGGAGGGINIPKPNVGSLQGSGQFGSVVGGPQPQPAAPANVTNLPVTSPASVGPQTNIQPVQARQAPQPGAQTNLAKTNVSAAPSKLGSFTGPGAFQALEALRDPGKSTERFNSQVANPLIKQFQERILPGVRRGFAGNLFGSERLNGERLVLDDLAKTLASESSRFAQEDSGRISSQLEAALESSLGREFAGGQAQAGRDFQASESVAGREFTSGEAAAGREGNALSEFLSQQFGADVNAANQQFQSGESSLGREFTGISDALDRAFQGGESGLDRVLARSGLTADTLRNLPGILGGLTEATQGADLNQRAKDRDLGNRNNLIQQLLQLLGTQGIENVVQGGTPQGPSFLQSLAPGALPAAATIFKGGA